MKERFEKTDTLVGALLAQRIIQGNRELASKFAEVGTLVECPPGKNLIEQGQTDRDVYFVLTGKLRIIVNGVRHHTREAGDTVGEMSALNPTISRSATLCAEETCVALKVDEVSFVAALDEHPISWRLIASNLARRIEQRNRYVNRTNPRPRVFIVSSVEALAIADEIQLGLQYANCVVIRWSDDEIFPVGAYPIEALEEQVSSADFCIAIASADDIVRARHRQQSAPRDNVIFELGFFMSSIGRHRTLLLVPRGNDIKIPTDFKGITPIAYDDNTDDQPLSSALGPTVTQIKKTIEKLGVRSSLQAAK